MTFVVNNNDQFVPCVTRCAKVTVAPGPPYVTPRSQLNKRETEKSTRLKWLGQRVRRFRDQSIGGHNTFQALR